MNARDLRPLGRSGVNVTTLGFGSAPLGNLYAPVADEQAATAVQAALEIGIRLFDTAPLYGFGLAEKRLASALRDVREPVVISTKVGRLLVPSSQPPGFAARQGYCSPEPFDAQFDYGYDAVMRSHEESLKRLGVGHIDILLGHDLGSLTHGAEHARHLREFLEGGYRAMRRLRDEGTVRAIGLGVNEWEICCTALDHGDFDCFLLAGRYTLLEQGALERFLPQCAARGVAVIVGGPFNSGILVAGSERAAHAHYNYLPPPSPVIERVRRIEAVCAEFEVPLPAAALQFPLAHPAVATVIPGCTSAAHVRQAAEYLAMPIPSSFWCGLRDAGLLAADAPVPA